jgi:electron transport complex protein RnfC
LGLFGKVSFKGGVHPPHHKRSTESLATEILPPPPTVMIPLSQHLGAPARVSAKRGDLVKIGQVLGETGGFVSAPVHASVSGKVTAVGDLPHPLGKHAPAVEIENDGKDETVEFSGLGDTWRDAERGAVVDRIASAGIVGMGGASFPTHVKLSPPGNKPIDTLILNGAECEPYLTADHRLMLEKTREILQGLLIIKKLLAAGKAYVGIEDNKPDAAAAIDEALRAGSDFDGVTVVRLRTKYPQGGEKQLINAITGRQVPSGGLPMDVGCVVHNVGTAYAVWDAVTNGVPLYKRIVTVTGPTVGKPANLLVRIGTPMRYVLEHCETDFSATKKVIMGGPMMGLAQAELEAPVVKATSGLLTAVDTFPGIRAYDCISCGNCVKACPIGLVPSMLAKFIAKDMYDDADRYNVLDCMECGSCAYVCPSKINLVHFMKLGKFHVSAARKAAQKRAT